MAKKGVQQAEPAAEHAYETGRAYEQAKEYEQAFACYLNAAQAGHVAAEERLGRCFELGRGVARDDKEAVAHFRRAAYARR